tara:strand:+ start:366 stop:542 length:177 start_codon:yes stop_codon:yes gene_type:complete
MSTHTRKEVIEAINNIWIELEKTWDSDVHPEGWDDTCESMAIIRESLGLEYNKHGELE